MLITKELLKKHRACKDQINKFDKLFPNGVDATRELCLAHAQTFNFTWTRRLLSPLARAAYDEAIAAAHKARDEATAPASKAYNEASAAAWKVYNEASVSAREASDEATSPAWKAYNEAIAAARKVYDETSAPARKAYDKAVVSAWFDASQLECEEVGLMAKKDTGE